MNGGKLFEERADKFEDQSAERLRSNADQSKTNGTHRAAANNLVQTSVRDDDIARVENFSFLEWNTRVIAIDLRVFLELRNNELNRDHLSGGRWRSVLGEHVFRFVRIHRSRRARC